MEDSKMDFNKSIFENRQELGRPFLAAHRGVCGANVPCNSIAAYNYPSCDVKKGKIFITRRQNSNKCFSDVYPIDVASECLEVLISKEIKTVCKS